VLWCVILSQSGLTATPSRKYLIAMKAVFTGGGTLGHVIPALSVAEELRKRAPDADIVYIGSQKENEREYVVSHGFEFIAIPAGKLRRYFSFENLVDIFRLLIGIVRAFFLIGRLRPDIVFSKGGYVSVPVVLAAALRGVPVITHESDISMGLANRINARFARRICLGFDTVHGDERYVYTGNPVRRDLIECMQTPDERPLLLILGGSLGAQSLNECIYAHLDELTERAYVVHQTGPTGRNIVHENYEHHEFIADELPSLIKRASLVISRAGANAISELRWAAVPMVLAPIRTNASRGDQIENARFLEERGEALVGWNDEELIEKAVRLLEDRSLSDRLRENCRREASVPSTERIVDLIFKELER